MPSLLPHELRKLDTPLVSSSLLDRAEGAPTVRTPPPLRPPREEIERRIAAGRRRRARAEKATQAGTPLDKELELYNQALAQKIADAGRSDGIAPILKDALDHEPEAAGPQIDHLIGELQRQAPEQAAALERELGDRRPGPRRRVSGAAPDPSLYMEFPDMPEITEAEDVGFWESFLPNIQIGMTTDPIEEARIIRDAFPDEVGGIYQDSFGNPIINFRGKDYYINKPGYSRQDTGTLLNAFALAYPIPRLAATGYRLNKDISKGLHGPRGPLGGGGSGGLVLERYVPPVTAPIQNASNFDIVEPQPSSPPPFIPPDPEELGQILVNIPPDLDELLSQIPPHPGFTPADKNDIIEIFPDQRDEIPPILVVESNPGNRHTVEGNEAIVKRLTAMIERLGLPIEFAGYEFHYPEWRAKKAKLPSRKGSNDLDFAFEHEETHCRVIVNTVDTLKNQITPDSREYAAELRILENKEICDILVLVPKAKEGFKYNLEELEKQFADIFEELQTRVPKPKPDNYSPNPLDSRNLIVRPVRGKF